ncbi:hypothetical protein D3C72_1885780 [compost metagenome]
MTYVIKVTREVVLNNIGFWTRQGPSQMQDGVENALVISICEAIARKNIRVSLGNVLVQHIG